MSYFSFWQQVCYMTRACGEGCGDDNQAFFDTSTVGRTVVICSFCLQHIKCDKYTNHLGTDCMGRHMILHLKS